MSIKFFAFSIGLFLPFILFSQSISSTLYNGYWSDPAIWSKGACPASTDSVIINHNIILDQDVVLQSPGRLVISLSGEICGDHSFTGSFTHYGSIKVNKLEITDTSYTYGEWKVYPNGINLVKGKWFTYAPGYGCTCPFTCNPIVPWQSPIADFGYPATICSGQTVQFKDMSQYYPTAWQWSFPGGMPVTSSQQNPIVTYNQSGIYDVTLISSNMLGEDTLFKANYVHVIPSPTVLVSSNTSINYGDSTILVATGGPPYTWDTGDTGSSISVSPTSITSYTVVVTAANGCTRADVVTVYVEPCPVLFLPNAFSPNADGENDFLQLYNDNQRCVKEVSIQIFDQWGTMVFSSTDRYFQWNGADGTALLNPGVFVYNLQIKMFDDSTMNKQGNISLVR